MKKRGDVISNLRSFFKARWGWLCSNPLLWLNLTLAAGTLATFLWPGSTDLRIRAWGTVLQLLGAYVVWRDISSSAREFGVANILRRNWAWLKAGFGAKTVIEAQAGWTEGGENNSAVGSVRISIDPSWPVEKRVSVLEEQINQVHESVSSAFALILQKERELQSRIRSLDAVLQAKIGSTDLRLQRAVVGNYPFLLLGAWWLAVGIFLSCLSPETWKICTGQWRGVLSAIQ